jgi:hypothetical protein
VKSLLLGSALALTLAPAAMAEVTLTVANNSSDSIATVSIYGLDEAGQPAETVLGSLTAPVDPGASATITLSLAECGPAYMRASYGDGTPIDGTVDLCSTPTIDFND